MGVSCFLDMVLFDNPQDGTWIVYVTSNDDASFVLIFVDVNVITFLAEWRQKERKQNGIFGCVQRCQRNFFRIFQGSSTGVFMESYKMQE